jgi:probable F420-dependent oxidoreductase
MASRGGEMELGLNLVLVRPDRMPELAARAEELGYESVFVPDHVVFPVQTASPYPYTSDGCFPIPFDTPLYDPWLVLMGIAQATSTIRLGTAVYVLALRHPLVAARAVTSLDVLSGGRAILGIGAGWLAEEFAALGLDPRERFSRTEEAVEVIRGLWTEPEFSWHGRHFEFAPVYFQPRPTSVPHPPIMLGGDSDTAVARAARLGDGWLSGGVSTDIGEIEARVARIHALRQQLGVTRPFNISVLYANPSIDELSRLEGIGVDRVVVRPWIRGSEARSALEAYADVAWRGR